MEPAVLTLKWLHRPGFRDGAMFKTERYSLDFVVNGVSLYDTLGIAKQDRVGALGWMPPAANQALIASLLLDGPASAPDERQALFVCPECGDNSCGALTAKVTRNGNQIVWQRFGFENDYDPEMADFEQYAAVGPFAFEETAYRAVLQSAASLRTPVQAG